MTDNDAIAPKTDIGPLKRKRNILLALALAGAALAMYASIFFRMSVSPLS